jgi:hypothetical protein
MQKLLINLQFLPTYPIFFPDRTSQILRPGTERGEGDGGAACAARFAAWASPGTPAGSYRRSSILILPFSHGLTAKKEHEHLRSRRTPIWHHGSCLGNPRDSSLPASPVRALARLLQTRGCTLLTPCRAGRCQEGRP